MYAMEKKYFFLVKTVKNAHYLTWWYISDLFPYLMYACENMAKIVCNTLTIKILKMKHMEHACV